MEPQTWQKFYYFGVCIFFTLSVFAYFIENLVDSVVLQAVILLIALFAEIAWVEFEHKVMKKEMIR